MADTVRVPLIATNDVLYHDHGRRPLQDVLTCVREKTTIDKVGRKLQANAERHLKPPHEMAKLFADYQDALAETVRFAGKIVFSLEDLKYQYPDEPVPPGRTAQEHLEYLTWAGTYRYFPDGIDENTRNNLFKELALIAKLNYAHYFLTVHDIVHYARSQNILCQGRGSAANSAVCFMLGVTVGQSAGDQPAVRALPVGRAAGAAGHRRRFRAQPARGGDAVCLPPLRPAARGDHRHRHPLSSAQRHPRRRQGAWADRGHHRLRSPTPCGEAGATATPASSCSRPGSIRTIPMIGRAIELATELIGFPRHLSQHVGGYVLTQDRLDTYVPIGNAAMEYRTFIEWDKDDVDALRMMKVDVLALGMLTCIRKSFDLIDRAQGRALRARRHQGRGRTTTSTRCCSGASRSACSRSRAGRR